MLRRIRRDFPEPGSANGVLRLIADGPWETDIDPARTERVQAAIVILAAGDLSRLREALDLAKLDWRDVLVSAGLANGDWPTRLDRELGPTDSGSAI